jgi:hypothetical protein
MEPQVLEMELAAIKGRRKLNILSAVFQAVFFTLLMFLWKLLSHRSDGHPLDLFLGCAFGGVIYGLLMYFLVLRQFSPKRKGRADRVSIVVERDQIASAYRSLADTSWIPQMVLHKGKVRSIFRIPGGIGVSERSQFGARMHGYLVIPDTLPKFEELRELLESWRRP